MNSPAADTSAPGQQPCAVARAERDIINPATYDGRVGSRLLSQNNRVRVWEIRLAPGERWHARRLLPLVERPPVAITPVRQKDCESLSSVPDTERGIAIVGRGNSSQFAKHNPLADQIGGDEDG
jgi:hypothetical protein